MADEQQLVRPTHVLWGTRYGFQSPDEHDQVALFSSEMDAKVYLDDSRMKSAPSWPRAGDNVFRATSLLRPYQSAWVEVYEAPEVLPMDPPLPR